MMLACRKESPARPSPSASASETSPPIAAKPEASAPALELDLLHWTPAAVTVSSNVENPRDYPHHLVDNKPETAWNGKTDDLNAEISFRVPKETHVKRIDLSAGFDKTGPKGDFFTMNHRITKVRVSKLENTQRVTIGEFSLDPNERKPQPIPIDKPGGAFLIEVLETVPGTKKEWRELTVSEMVVLGDPGPKKLAQTRMPDVKIGGRVDENEPATSTGGSKQELEVADHLPLSGSSAADLCARWEKVVAPIFASHYSVEVYPGPPEKPYCKPSAPIALPAGSRAKAVRTVTLTVIDGVEEHLLVETDEGAIVPRDALLREQSTSYSMAKLSAKVLRAKMEGTEVVAGIEHVSNFELYCVGSSEGSPTRQYIETTELDLRCNLDAKPLGCTRQERKRSCRGSDCEMLGYPRGY